MSRLPKRGSLDLIFSWTSMAPFLEWSKYCSITIILPRKYVLWCARISATQFAAHCNWVNEYCQHVFPPAFDVWIQLTAALGWQHKLQISRSVAHVLQPSDDCNARTSRFHIGNTREIQMQNYCLQSTWSDRSRCTPSHSASSGVISAWTSSMSGIHHKRHPIVCLLGKQA